MTDANPNELEASYINMMALVLDLLVASKTVTTPVLVHSIGSLADQMKERGYGQATGHLIHFQDFLTRREAQRSTVQSLLKEPPGGSA